MREIGRQLVEPALGMISLLASWEAWGSILTSLLLALVGGFLGYVGKELAKAIFHRGKDDED